MIRTLTTLLVLLSLCVPALAQEPALGNWHGELDGPGGEIPFDFALEASADGALSGRLLEPMRGHTYTMRPYSKSYPSVGIEPITVRRDGARITLSIEHYDSHFQGELSADGAGLSGTWRKRSGPDVWAELPFAARAGERPPWPPPPHKRGGPEGPLTGRYAVDFSSSEVPAVMELREDFRGRVSGTILTHVGDYRFLAGRHENDTLTLTTFDGAHAFRFVAATRRDPDQPADTPGNRIKLALEGDFWSRDSWHETWTARRDDDARLPDAFQETVWKDDVALADLVFADLDGAPRSLADPAFAGDALLLQVFGTWCPNCNDETRYLVELHKRFAERGLAIVGLAFELSGEPERDAAQVRAYAERHDVPYPMLLAGTANKAAATEALAALDRVRSFPTTIFLTGDGRVRAVHSGFTGPATGPAHETLRAEFEGLIEELLAEETDARSTATWRWLRAQDFFDHQAPAGGDARFFEDDGARRVLLREYGSGEPILGTEARGVRVAGDAVWIGDELWRVERELDALTSPHRAGARLASMGRADAWSGGARALARAGYGTEDAELARALGDADALVRRAALWHLVDARRPQARARLTEALPLLDDPDRRVRLCAAWALAAVGEHEAVAPLLERLSSRDAAVRRESIRALGRFAQLHILSGDPQRIRAALEPHREDPDPLARDAARIALEP